MKAFLSFLINHCEANQYWYSATSFYSNIILKGLKCATIEQCRKREPYLRHITYADYEKTNEEKFHAQYSTAGTLSTEKSMQHRSDVTSK